MQWDTQGGGPGIAKIAEIAKSGDWKPGGPAANRVIGKPKPTAEGGGAT
jgi:hypothetical protein